MTNEKPDNRMLVGVERPNHSDYLYVVARPVYIVTENGAEHVRNFSSSGFDCHPLADLQVRAWIDGEKWYQSDVEYHDAFAVDEHRAIAMAKLLGKIRRGLEKYERELGFTEDYAARLARVANVLGISRYGFKAGGGGLWHDGYEYRWVDASYLRDMIAQEVERDQKAHAR